MDFFDLRALKQQARDRVAQTPNARMLVLVYLGVLGVLGLASGGLNLYLNSQISGTGGLSGLGLRSVLQTVQMALSYANMLFGPFWQAGFLFCVIRMVRGQQTGPRELGEGFHRFGRIISHALNSGLVTLGLLFVSVYAGSFLFSFSPWGADFAEAMGPVLTDPNLFNAEGMINLDMIPMEAMRIAAGPLMVMIFLVFLPLQAYVSYGFRMSRYLLMQGGLMTGLGALLLSWRMTRGHRTKFLRLDLSYWWYYLLLALALVLGYLDVILSALSLPLPVNAKVMFFVTMVLYLAAEMAISLWKKCEVDAASVLICEEILKAHNEAIQQTMPPADPS